LGAYQNSEAIKKSQLEDPEIRQVIAFKRDCEDAPSADVVAVKVYLTHWPLLELKDGLLCCHRPTGDGTTFDLQIVMPDKLRQDFLRLAHSGFGGGHLGSRRTAKTVQARAYWVGWGADTRRFCQSCDVCARYRRGPAPRQGALRDMTTGAPWERLGVDITGPHPKSFRGHVYILTVMDYFTKWARRLPNQEPGSVDDC